MRFIVQKTAASSEPGQPDTPAQKIKGMFSVASELDVETGLERRVAHVADEAGGPGFCIYDPVIREAMPKRWLIDGRAATGEGAETWSMRPLARQSLPVRTGDWQDPASSHKSKLHLMRAIASVAQWQDRDPEDDE
jgi:hypothetical protein